MAVAIATSRPRLRLGPALRPGRLPMRGLALSALLHVTLAALIIVTGHVWRANQPKTYHVVLTPAIPAVGIPQGRTRVPQPELPRVQSPVPPAPTRAPALPDREPARAPERPTKATELPERAPAPRESVALPDRTRPSRAPTLPRPGEKELPRVASVPPPPATTTPPGRPAAPPPPTLGRPTGVPHGSGAITADVSDFPFAWYLRQVESKIGERWEGKARDGNQPQVVFVIGRDGKLRELAVEKSSGNPLYDQAALRAINDALPFPPLPAEFKEPFLRVHLGFGYSGTRG